MTCYVGTEKEKFNLYFILYYMFSVYITHIVTFNKAIMVEWVFFGYYRFYSSFIINPCLIKTQNGHNKYSWYIQ